MCADKDPPPCEHGELIALVSRQQDQGCASDDDDQGASQAARRSAASGQAPGGAILQGQTDLKAQTSGSKARHGELQLP